MKNNLEDNGLKTVLEFLSITEKDFSWKFLENAKTVDISEYIECGDLIPVKPGIYIISTNKNFTNVVFCPIGIKARITKQSPIRKKIASLLEFDYDLKFWYNEFSPDSILGEFFYKKTSLTSNFHQQLLIEELKPLINNRQEISILSPHEEKYYRKIISKKGNCEGFSIWVLKEMLMSTSLYERGSSIDERYFKEYREDEEKVLENNIIIYDHLKNIGFYE